MLVSCTNLLLMLLDTCCTGVGRVRTIMPRNFFENHVKPNYEEWLADPLSERHAKHAVSDANIMAVARLPASIFGAPGRIPASSVARRSEHLLFTTARGVLGA